MVFVILAACNGNKQVPEPVEGPSKELSAIDSLLWLQPDSALACLIPYFDTCCRDVSQNVSDTSNDGIWGDVSGNNLGDVSGNVSTYNRHYAHLLLAELLYKNYYAQTNRLELLQAVAYFDSLVADTHGVSLQGSRRRDARRASAQNTAFLDARAHYINGVGYYEQDSVVPACKEYLKAVEVMEEHFEEEELVGKKAKFMALTYTHLSELFSSLYLHEQAIFFDKLSLGHYRKYEAESLHIAWVLNNIGVHFDMVNEYDSAYFYYNKGLEILTDTNSLIYRDITTHLAFLSYKERGNTIESLNQLNNIASKASSIKEYYSRYLSIGEIFYNEKQYDSAWFYYKKVFEFTQSEGSKKLAAERLVEIGKITGNDIDTSEYIDYLIPFTNQEEIKSAVKSQLTELYNSFNQCRLEQLHQQEKKKNLKWALIIALGFLVLLFVVLALYHRNKIKSRSLEMQMKEERLSHSIQQKSLSGRLKQKSQEMRILQDQIKQRNDRVIEADPSMSFTDEPICQLILDRVKEGQFKSQMDCAIYKDFALDKTQVLALHDAVDRHFIGYTTRLKKTYSQLTNSDLNYCCLYLLGLTDADIAALLQKAYPTVSQRSRKLKAVLGSETSLPDTLRNFANNNASY